LNAFEHGLKLGKERGFIGSTLVDTRPSDQRPPADVDDSDSNCALGLEPVTILGRERALAPVFTGHSLSVMTIIQLEVVTRESLEGAATKRYNPAPADQDRRLTIAWTAQL
jgi:hypothetical protein